MDIYPETTAETVYSITVCLCGSIMWAFVVAATTSLLAGMDQGAQRARNEAEMMNHFMRFRRVPRRLRLMVNQYQQYRWSCMRGMDEANALATLPASLRLQLHVAFNEKIFSRVPLFRDCEPPLIVALAERLRPIIAIPGEYVIREGTLGSAIYLISRGRLAVLKKTTRGTDAAAPPPTTIATLSDHDFFGEASLVNASVTSASVRALIFCDLMYLTSAHFKEVLTKFPDFNKQVAERAISHRTQEERQKNRQEPLVRSNSFLSGNMRTGSMHMMRSHSMMRSCSFRAAGNRSSSRLSTMRTSLALVGDVPKRARPSFCRARTATVLMKPKATTTKS